MNMDVMRKHLSLISKRTLLGRHAVIIVDGAAWQCIRQNELANRYFKGYDDIVDSYCSAWRKFIKDIDRVKKLCSRDWIEVG
jgi:hypothetical protein